MWPLGSENPVSAWTPEMSLSSHKTAACRRTFYGTCAPERWQHNRGNAMRPNDDIKPVYSLQCNKRPWIQRKSNPPSGKSGSDLLSCFNTYISYNVLSSQSAAVHLKILILRGQWNTYLALYKLSSLLENQKTQTTNQFEHNFFRYGACQGVKGCRLQSHTSNTGYWKQCQPGISGIRHYHASTPLKLTVKHCLQGREECCVSTTELLH